MAAIGRATPSNVQSSIIIMEHFVFFFPFLLSFLLLVKAQLPPAFLSP
jgi:hypothetical protein